VTSSLQPPVAEFADRWPGLRAMIVSFRQARMKPPVPAP
jgi:hypothetical protein